MVIFESENLNSLYVKLVQSLISDGKEIVKENKKIKEIYPCMIKIPNPKEGF